MKIFSGLLFLASCLSTPKSHNAFMVPKHRMSGKNQLFLIPKSRAQHLKGRVRSYEKEINIDNAMMEAEEALKLARTVLAEKPQAKTLTTMEVKEAKDGDSSDVVTKIIGGVASGAGSLILGAGQVLVDGMVSAAKRKVDTTAKSIQEIPGKMVDSAAKQIQEIPGHIANSAKDSIVQKTTDIVEDIKATPGHMVDSAKESIMQKATDIVEDIKATPGHIVDSAKESILQKTTDVVEDIKATPGYIVDSAKESILQKTTEIVIDVQELPAHIVDSAKESILQKTTEIEEDIKASHHRVAEKTRQSIKLKRTEIAEDIKATHRVAEKTRQSVEEAVNDIRRGFTEAISFKRKED